MRIIALISFLIVVGLIIFASQVPTIDGDKVEAVIKEAISTSEVTTGDEDIIREAVNLSVTELEAKQQKRLNYLVSAYLVIWLVFMLYLVKLGKQQSQLDIRLAQLEQDTPNTEEPK